MKKYRVEIYTFDRTNNERGCIRFDEIEAENVDRAVGKAYEMAEPQLRENQRFIGSQTQMKD